ncbi:uncharacterized protein LOC122386404, partial [Amphibalanus amphitrite]|uniref:uncharacterized protein LOC122386404 n=1 Tax=Amphibalanus amphitrite TaxID=1232801 RepID=UPI001C900C16
SGIAVPPFSFSGFLAQLEVNDLTDLAPPGPPSATDQHTAPEVAAPDQKPSILLDGASAGRVAGCNLLFSGHRQRTGFFSAGSQCNVTFLGRPSDLVAVSLINYKLSGPRCTGVLEVHGDGPVSSEDAARRHCSPAFRTVRDSLGRASVAQKIWSSSNKMLIVFRPRAAPNSGDFVEGAYLFHNADSEGHLTSQQLCHAQTDAEVSARSGQVTMPEGVPLLWDLEGPLSCRHTFRVRGRTLAVQVSSPDGSPARLTSHHCVTRCSGHRCRCLVDLVRLRDVDHLQFLTTDGRPIACLCGNFTAALPLALSTNVNIVASYNMAHFMWAAVGPNFTLHYQFEEPGCPRLAAETGIGTLTLPSPSSLSSAPTAELGFSFFTCLWTLPAVDGVGRTLTLQTTGAAGGGARCSQLNVSVTSLARDVHGLDELVDVFCVGQGLRQVVLRPGVNHTLRLTKLGPAAATYQLQWKLEVRRSAAVALLSPPLTRLVWWLPLLLNTAIT